MWPSSIDLFFGLLPLSCLATLLVHGARLLVQFSGKTTALCLMYEWSGTEPRGRLWASKPAVSNVFGHHSWGSNEALRELPMVTTQTNSLANRSRLRILPDLGIHIPASGLGGLTKGGENREHMSCPKQ